MTSSDRNSSWCDSSYYSISIAKTNIHISLIIKPITVKKVRNAPDEGMRQSKDLKVPGKENNNIPVYFTKKRTICNERRNAANKKRVLQK